jgi:hypothetical protein
MSQYPGASPIRMSYSLRINSWSNVLEPFSSYAYFNEVAALFTTGSFSIGTWLYCPFFRDSITRYGLVRHGFLGSAEFYGIEGTVGEDVQRSAIVASKYDVDGTLRDVDARDLFSRRRINKDLAVRHLDVAVRAYSDAFASALGKQTHVVQGTVRAHNPTISPILR